MSRKRIIYQNWIVELGRDPDLKYRQKEMPEIVSLDSGLLGKIIKKENSDLNSSRVDRKIIREKVQAALAKLSSDEQEFIRQFYFMGISYREISEKSGRAVYRLEALHRRAVKKLHKTLACFVEARFKMKVTQISSIGKNNCPICNSSSRTEIDSIISNRDPRKSWRPVISEIGSKFELKIKSPQLLIGHEKYHR